MASRDRRFPLVQPEMLGMFDLHGGRTSVIIREEKNFLSFMFGEKRRLAGRIRERNAFVVFMN